MLHSVQLADLPISVPHADQHEWWVKFYRRVKIKLFQFMHPEAIKSVRTHFEPVLDNFFDFKPVLRHCDFGTFNVLWNGQDITGIIDFGDIAIDLAGLLSGYGEEFIFALNYLNLVALHGYKNDDEEAFKAGMKNYAL